MCRGWSGLFGLRKSGRVARLELGMEAWIEWKAEKERRKKSAKNNREKKTDLLIANYVIWRGGVESTTVSTGESVAVAINVFSREMLTTFPAKYEHGPTNGGRREISWLGVGTGFFSTALLAEINAARTFSRDCALAAVAAPQMIMEWGKLFKSSSAEKKEKEQRKNSLEAAAKSSSDHHHHGAALPPTPTTRRPSPPSAAAAAAAAPELPPKSSKPRSAVSSPVLSHPSRTLTQIVQLTKEVEVRGSPVANATAAVIDRSLMEVRLCLSSLLYLLLIFWLYCGGWWWWPSSPRRRRSQ